MTAKPYSPQTLAERWGCSDEKIRLMYRSGELAGFTLGKLIRIPAHEVERYECLTGDLPDTEENGRSLGPKVDERFESRLVRQTEGLPKVAPVNSGQREPAQSRIG
ncbi:hypothetical protein [Sphingorhabdus sp. SMR4y]|uniref:hypothetical protein n=1 Tax=Sphingorhabdus sp. SMR4y TaxID=2584094 RepID=UPI000B62310F|nr:hypothetical protein [Sphingorhabdus sp. SMR4y]ASK88508.1 excise: DNA binding domain, excisionase family [Sphingorhabdus sp. SMR4y]